MTEKKPHPVEKQNTKNQKNVSSHLTTPPLDDIPEREIPEDKHGKNGKHHGITWRFEKETRESLLVWANIITLITFISFSWYQGCQTRKSLSVATQTLNLTRESDSVSDKIRKVELRAYLAVSNSKMNRYKVGDLVEFVINIINVGKTPAYKIYHSSLTYLTNNKDLGAKPFFDTAIYKNGSVDLGAGLHIGSVEYTTYKLSAQDSIDIHNGKTFFVSIGIYYYKDIFGDIHWARYSRYYAPETGTFNACQGYNDTDDIKIAP